MGDMADAWIEEVVRTRAMLVGTVLEELQRGDLTTGLVTMCTGGGMGTATVLERA